MRKCFSVLFPAVLVLLSLLLSAAHAAVPGESWKNEETGFEAVINDSAHLLSDSEISSVLDAMVPVTSYAGAGFMTSDSSAGNWRCLYGFYHRYGVASPGNLFQQEGL